MATGARLTTTSFAILGLLAVQPWSTYELTRQLDRSVGRFWPRAESKLYEEPKKLVEHGLAEATTERVGRRPRTVYAITDAGRAALAGWLAVPGAGPVLECEQLVQVGLAEHGSRQAVLDTLAAARAWAVERNTGNLAAARQYRDGTSPFPQRAAQNLLVGAFLTDFYALVASWSDWAGAQVEAWPDDPGRARADPAEQAAVADRAAWSERDG